MFGDLLGIGMQAITNARQLLCSRRMVTRADRGDQAIPPTSRKYHFGDMRCEGDHALGWGGKVDSSPGIIDQLNRLGLGCRHANKPSPQQQYRRHPTEKLH